ncbi:WD40 repeat-like protein [Laetiporus sulphureus 93-53]|uniref:WD40 repeat-like protein n=1 Tax=Laetiporus sulphureus 93-53 TaxID=1314785 RepID=A0A165CRB6_9APHY|nr:WD40 repeat-like protein [Laetiporus sulphureus 93-53]KZT03288.1 WD40 repeat-like protein [Laetiporus sulphureus 93-53]
MRTLSSSSLSDLRSPVVQPPVPESASNHLRSGKFVIDFSVSDEVLKAGAYPVSWSENNYMVFGRGNRVHYKNFSANEEISQVCKVPEGLGNLRAVQCGGKDQRNNVAIITMKGIIQIWDLSTKKMTLSWPTKRTPTVMHWNGPILSVGGERGSIRHFDTRIHEARKPVNPVHKVTRHQLKISSLLWNPDGGFFASGDEGGTVHVWDSRQKAPLEVGELVQRRRKMQHVGAVTALAWCPWQSKLLASGDSAPDATGTICVWNINNTSSSQPNYPMKLELDAQVTSLHFSAHCKELLSTHGPGKSTPAPPPSVQLDSHSFPNETMPSRIANSVVVHAIPSLRQVVKLEAAKVNIAGSVMSPNGQRIVLAIPEESKLKVWDVWGKVKELKRTSSSLTLQIR